MEVVLPMKAAASICNHDVWVSVLFWEQGTAWFFKKMAQFGIYLIVQNKFKFCILMWLRLFKARYHVRMRMMCQCPLTLWASSCLSWWMFTTPATHRKSQVSNQCCDAAKYQLDRKRLMSNLHKLPSGQILSNYLLYDWITAKLSLPSASALLCVQC